jgi:putative phosphoesterase
VVADTHVGEFLDALPETVLTALEGCDLILHAGDLSVISVLDDLAQIAPVVAVRGDHDRLDGLALPETAVVVAGGHRIGLVHGHRTRLVDASVVAVSVAAGRALPYRARMSRALVRRMGPVDAVVFGHWHERVTRQEGGTLLFSPGAVCPWGSLEGGRAVGTGMTGVNDRAVRRFRRQLGAEAMRPSVGVLEVGSGGIRPRSILLDSR